MSSREPISDQDFPLLRILSWFPIDLQMQPEHINLAFKVFHDLVPINDCSSIFCSIFPCSFCSG